MRIHRALGLVPSRLGNFGGRVLTGQRSRLILGLGRLKRSAEPVDPREDLRVDLGVKLRLGQRAGDLEDEIERPHGFIVGQAGLRRA